MRTTWFLLLVATLALAACGDPEPEDCQDNFDNDEDGAVDCDDDECCWTPTCHCDEP